MKPKILVILSVISYLNKKDYYLNRNTAGYLNNLSKFYELELCGLCFGEGSKEKNEHSWIKLNKKIKICEINKKNSIFILNKKIKNADCLYIFLPGPFGFLSYLLNKIYHKPYFLYVGSDLKDILYYHDYPLWYKFLVRLIEKNIIKKSRFAQVEGQALFEKYSKLNKNIFVNYPMFDFNVKDINKTKDPVLIPKSSTPFLDFKIPSSSTIVDAHLFPSTTSPQTLVKSRNSEQSQTKFNYKKLKILFVGIISRRKGVYNFVPLARKLKKKGIDFEINFLGKGSMDVPDNLKKNFNFLNIAKNKKEIIKIYRQHNLFVFPTNSEGFPRVLYEAMSQGLPIITTRVSGIPYVMKHKENCFLVDKDDVDGILEGVEKIMKDKQFRDRIIKNSLETVKPFLENNIVEQIKHYIDKLK